MHRRSRRATIYLVVAAFLFVVAELMAYAVYSMSDGGYFAPRPSFEQFKAALEFQASAENFREGVGWIALRQDRDADDARRSPDNPGNAPACVSLYGDSFVFGNDVDEYAAWGNQLAKLLGCRVLNFGVSGYGTDQAFLRFRANTTDPSDIVILGMTSENIVRNVNQNRAFIYPGEVGPFKPRFYFDENGEFRLEPLVRPTPASYDDYILRPERLFRREYFIPGSSNDAQQIVTFPYSINLIRALRYRRIYDSLLFYLIRNPPWFAHFYEPSHPSGALKVTGRIIEEFARLARARGKTPIVMFLPTSRDFGSFLKGRTWVYQDLLSNCLAGGNNCFNAGADLIARLGEATLVEQGVCEYFCTVPLTYSGHYNEKGNAALARSAMQYLAGYLPRRP